MTLKIKRTHEMVELEKAVIKMIWDDVKNIPDDGVWRKYERSFTYQKEKYLVKCGFRVDNQFLSYRNMVISYDTKTIILEQDLRLH